MYSMDFCRKMMEGLTEHAKKLPVSKYAMAQKHIDFWTTQYSIRFIRSIKSGEIFGKSPSFIPHDHVVNVDRKEDGKGNVSVTVKYTPIEHVPVTTSGKKAVPSTSIPSMVLPVEKLPENTCPSNSVLHDYVMIDYGDRVPYVRKDGTLSESRMMYTGSKAVVGYSYGKTLQFAYKNVASIIGNGEKLIACSDIEHAFTTAYHKANSDAENHPTSSRQLGIQEEYSRIMYKVVAFQNHNKPIMKQSESIRREYFERNGSMIYGDVTYRTETTEQKTVDDVIMEGLQNISIDAYEYFSTAYKGIMEGKADDYYSQRMKAYSSIGEHVDGERTNSKNTNEQFIIINGEVWKIEKGMMKAMMSGQETYIDVGRETRQSFREYVERYNRRVGVFHQAVRDLKKAGKIDKADVQMLVMYASNKYTMKQIAEYFDYANKSTVSRKIASMKAMLIDAMANYEESLKDSANLQKLKEHIEEKQAKQREHVRKSKEKARQV